MTTPGWLERLTRADTEEGPLPLEKILGGCCYYPAAGFDRTAVRAYGERVSSFVHTDWLWGRDDLLEALTREPFTGSGYRILGLRDVREAELNPSGKRPRTPRTLRDYPVPNGAREGAFATWTVWERLEGFDDDHGPGRFSLLHLRSDGAAAYQVLFEGNRVLPEIVCSIRPGRGGVTSSNFDEIFLECIDMHPMGRPPLVSLWGGSMHSNSVWRFECDFDRPIHVTKKDFEDEEVCLFRLFPRG
jgi:hypothetical protein